MSNPSKWSDRPTSLVTDPELEEALSEIDVAKGQYVWVVRPHRRKLQTYASKALGYDNAMKSAAIEADNRGGPSVVEVYQYSGKGAWVFVRSATVTVTQPPRWGNPVTPTKTKLLK